jgi:hypothetical protein
VQSEFILGIWPTAGFSIGGQATLRSILLPVALGYTIGTAAVGTGELSATVCGGFAGYVLPGLYGGVHPYIQFRLTMGVFERGALTIVYSNVPVSAAAVPHAYHGIAVMGSTAW